MAFKRSGITGGGAGVSVDGRKLVRTGPSTLYCFDSTALTSSQLLWSKSSDNGMTWSVPGAALASVTVNAMSVWYDRWTQGDSGTRIHIAALDVGGDDVRYAYLDTANDTIGGAVVVFAGASFTTAVCSMTKARGGYLYIGFDGDTGTEKGFYRSVDAGANWTSRTDSLNEATPTGDVYQLMPGNYADNQDIDAVFWDASATEISLKVYDDSANSWAESSISGSMTGVSKATAGPQLSASIRHSDGHLILVAWNSRDVGTADLKCWDINGSGSIVAKTDVVTNADDCQAALLSIDQSTDHLYVFYLGKSDGSEVVGTAVGAYFKVSTDGATTWGAEQTLISETGNFGGIGGSLSYSGACFNVMVAIMSTTQPIAFVTFEDRSGAGRGIGRGM